MARGKGHKEPPPGGGVERSEPAVQADLVGELTERMESLRAEIRRMEQLAADGDSVAATANDRLTSLRTEADWLEAAVDRSSQGHPPDMPQAGTGTHLAGRAGRLRARRRRGVRHVVHLDIWDHDLDALISAGELAATDATDAAKVADAVEDIFDRWVHGYLAGSPAKPEEEAVPPPAPPGPRPVAAPPEAPTDDRRETETRRSGMDRRRARGEVSNILRMIEGSPLDRRKSPDRRLTNDRRFSDR